MVVCSHLPLRPLLPGPSKGVKMSYGCAKIPRGIRKHKSWRKKPFSAGQALVELFMDITFKRSRILEGVKLREGQLFVKKKELAKRWGWTVKRVKRFLRSLEKDKGEIWEIKQEIARTPAANPGSSVYEIGTIITFINYDRICEREGEEMPDL